MNKNKNDLFLDDDMLVCKTTELLQTECYQPEDAKILLDTILELRLDDVSMQSEVDECFTAIKNLAGIPVVLMNIGSLDENSWKEYAIRFFSKAIYVMDSDLQTSVDLDERHQDTYDLKENFLNASEVNYAYAKSIIENELVQCFDVSDKPDEVVSLFKNVMTPVYTQIKKILIDVLEGDDYVNDTEFNTLEQAQEYIRNIKGIKKLKFEIRLILIDQNELFDEIELPLHQECEDEYWNNSIPTMVQEYIESPYLNDFSHKVDMSKYQEQRLNSSIGQLDNERKETLEDKQISTHGLINEFDKVLDKFIEHINEQGDLPNYSLYVGKLIETFNEIKQEEDSTSALKAFDDVLHELAKQIENDEKADVYNNLLSKVIDASFDIALEQDEKLWASIETTLWQWADKFNIPHDVLPRDRDGLIELTELEIIRQGLITPLNDVSELADVLEEEKEAFYLPVELFELTDLTKLEVFGMSLTYLPDEIEKLEKLTELKLTMNQLEMIPSSVGNLKNLTTLDLSINWLEEIPITLAKLKNLKYLNIDSDQLTITSSQEDWLYNLADDGCEVIWNRDNTTVIGSEDEYDEEQGTRDLIEMLGGEEALTDALKSIK